jgi:alpha-mannosidase
MEEGDVNMPDGEALVRQVLYGNEYFRKEFGVQSQEYMLPDCFGFQASLPSILAHCGLSGFSTQKLTWGSAVGIPFNVGVWEGPDGKSIVAALNCGAYDAPISEDLSHSNTWVKRVQKDGDQSGVYVDYRYYGVGDRGGSPHESSVKMLEKSVSSGGPLKVISSKADQMFIDLTPAQIAKLPRYKGDLLLTGHSTGELSSEAFMKRCERKIENLADAAERSSVAAEWLGSAAYPMEKINAAWTLALGAQFHDTMAGTALPKSYEYSWNNEILSLNQFAAVTEDGSGAVIRAMDTRAQGVPIVVFNPLAADREDLAEATVTLPAGAEAVSVFGPDGNAVPAQVLSHDGNTFKIAFLAKAPSVGFATYDARPTAATETPSSLKVTANTLENEHLKVTLNADGDIASIYDKSNQHEMLSAPARLEFLYENPVQWPAWNMDYSDRMAKPRGYVDGPAKIRIVENGPARIALEVEREAEGSKIVQQIRLSAGAAGDRVEVACKIDWKTQERSLEAVFPLTVSNPNATYESQSAAVERGNNNPKKFEVPQQQWFDVTDTSKSAGVAILNDSKYGSDKPNDNTVRLTLLYTPGTKGGYQDQGSQDLGRHEIVYAFEPHSGSWQQSKITLDAQRLNQPLLTFQSPAHEGTLGKTFSFCTINNPHVTATAIKKAEDSDEIIVRLHELTGTDAKGVRVSFAGQIESAREVDGQERPIAPTALRDGHLVVDMTPFGLRAFAVKIAKPTATLAGPVTQPVPLAYDLDAVTTHENLSDGAFDNKGTSFAAEGLPKQIVSEGIPFTVGPTADGQKNALICKGQTIDIPKGDFDRVYVLAAAVDGDTAGTFTIAGKPEKRVVQDWSGYIGQWDNRVWQGVVPGLTYNWKNKLAGLVPGFIKRDTVAWFYSHRHQVDSGNQYYQFSYLYKYGFNLPAGATSITLPDNDRIRVFAITAAKNANDDVKPARPLYDTLADHIAGDGPALVPAGGKFNDVTTVSLAPSLYWNQSALHYTTDGSEPTAASPLYTGPFTLDASATVKTKEIDEKNPNTPTTSAVFEINDTTPPKMVSASGIAAIPTVTVEFSKLVHKEQAETPANYHFQPALEVTAAELSSDGLRATLTLAKAAAGSDYTLTTTGITDMSPNANPVASSPVPFTIGNPVFTLESYDCATDGLQKKVAGLPVKGTAPWTINFFARADSAPPERTIIAGFGRNSDSTDDGSGRYLTQFSEGIHFWSRNADIDGEGASKFDTKRWMMLSATYDGHTVRMFKNGHKIGEGPLTLADDESVVRIAPTDPWEHQRRFTGQIRNFTIWPVDLQSGTLSALAATAPQEK